MHILLIPSWYTTPLNPIRGSFFHEQALALKKRGHQVGMLVPPSKLRTWHGLNEVRHYWRQSYTKLQIDYQDDIATYRMPWWGWNASINPFQRGDAALEVFDRYCSTHGRPDLLHAHSVLYGGYLAAYIGQQRALPVVLTEHSSLFRRGRPLIQFGQEPFIRYTLDHSDQCLAVSQPLADAMLARYGSKSSIEVVQNPVNMDFFVPPSEIPPLVPFTFAIVARLDQNKAVDLLLKAFASIFTGNPNRRLWVIGDGRERGRLEQLVSQLNLTAQVSFLGQQPRAQVRDLLQATHALVSCSYIETFGITLLEALACGKPVIATRSGGPDTIVTPTNGLLVSTGDVHALANALQKMVGHYDNYDAVKIRAECVALYSTDAVMTRLEVIYARVLANYARSASSAG